MKTTLRFALPLLLTLCSCAVSSTMRPSSELRSSLGDSGLFTERTIAELEALEPRSQNPRRIAVSPPLRVANHGWGTSKPALGAWSQAEKAVVEAWAEKLEAEGLVDELILLPNLSLAPSGGEGDAALFATVRQAAARHRAEAVLVVQSIDAAEHRINLASILDLTIIGMWLVPGHENEVLCVMEGMLIDTGSEYLFFSADAEARAKKASALAYMDQPELENTARADALDALAEEIAESWLTGAPGAAAARVP